MDALSKPCGLSPEEIRRHNNELMRLFSAYLNVGPAAVGGDTVREIARECRVSPAEAYALSLAALVGLDAGGADRVFYEYWLKPSVKRLDLAPFCTDPYLQNVRLPEVARAKWQLTNKTLAPFEAFVCGDPVLTADRRMIPQIGFFEEPYTYPAVLEDGREWMTLLPNETLTTRPALEKAHGRVLTYGLGLGYFVYHAAAKENVASVTAVDISPDVIELFRTYILPQLPHPEKVTLVCDDAFRFAETSMADNFDFVFADIWHDASDGCDLYLKMKPWEARFPAVTFTYWIEDTLRLYLDPTLW